MKPLACLAALFAIILAQVPACGQTDIRNEGKKAADAFIAKAPSLVGKAKDEVIIQIGMADSVTNSDNLECWKYRKLFGNYQRKKAVFGRISMTWEARLELIFKDGVVVSSKPSPVYEVRLHRGEVTQ